MIARIIFTRKMGIMRPEYQKWIDEYLARVEYPLGRCHEACSEMVLVFPELKKISGHVHCSWGKRAHFWLEADTGEVVDPTASQFPVIFGYEVWKPGDKVRVGKCMNCGEEIWKPVYDLTKDHSYYGPCSEECFLALKSDLETNGQEAVLDQAIKRVES